MFVGGGTKVAPIGGNIASSQPGFAPTSPPLRTDFPAILMMLAADGSMAGAERITAGPSSSAAGRQWRAKPPWPLALRMDRRPLRHENSFGQDTSDNTDAIYCRDQAREVRRRLPPIPKLPCLAAGRPDFPEDVRWHSA